MNDPHKNFYESDKKFCDSLQEFREWLREEKLNLPNRVAEFEAATAEIRKSGCSPKHNKTIDLARAIVLGNKK